MSLKLNIWVHEKLLVSEMVFFLYKMSSDYYMEYNNTGLSDLQLKMQ